ncbi:MAG: hypothetical protein IJZ03_05685 [Clostridia bacterium]|nr:hypothetical protein [Clostridia bacterium]
MTKKTTRRALITSVISMLLCVTMLVGTTFAWFTDSVKSGKNRIVAGNLDIELEYSKDMKSWKSVAEQSDLLDPEALWEPGHTEVVYLRISNLGSLALEYQFSMNVYDKVIGESVLGNKIDLADYLKYGVVDCSNAYADRDAALDAVENVAIDLDDYFANGAMEAGDAPKTLALVVYMPTTVGNEANHKTGTIAPAIELGVELFATQDAVEYDSFDNQYDAGAAIYVKNTAEAQAALDNAKKDDVIVLAPGVDYGTLFLRPVDGNANTTTSLNEANGEGLTGYRNEYIRTVENLTILGATNAKVDAIKVVSGYIEGSGSSCNLVDVKGLVIDSVEFTDKADCAPHTYSAPIFFNLTWTDVDGLTVKNCKLIGNDDKVNFVYFTIDGSSAFDGVASNVTLTGNTVDGIARLCELRQTENVTITDNVIKNTVLHGILLPVHNGSYSGDVTITGNTAYGINDRFVRMAGAGDANVVIKDNTITNYLGEDADYIKVTDSNGTPVIENNTLVSIGVKDAAAAQAALDNAVAGTTIQLQPGVNYGTLLLRPVDGNANTTTSLNEADGEGLTGYRNEYIRKVENLTIIGAPSATVDAIKVESGYIVGSGSSCNLVDVKGLVIDSVEFTDKADCAPHTYSAPIFFNLTWTDVDGLTVKNCKLIGNDDKVNFVYFTIDGSSAFDGVASNVTLTGNTVDGIARLCELRQTENVTITDNVIKNTVLHGILLPVHNGSYTGDVTITGNTAVGINERFVRMAGAGDANVVIKDNTILNYKGEDADYIKVTDSNGTPVIENNTFN